MFLYSYDSLGMFLCSKTESKNVCMVLFSTQHLYQLQGARTFWIHNTGPIGCLPFTLLFVNNNPLPGFLDQYGCVKVQNDMAVEFNKQLKDKVIQLRTQLPHAVLTYVDVYSAKITLISNAKNQGTTIF